MTDPVLTAQEQSRIEQEENKVKTIERLSNCYEEITFQAGSYDKMAWYKLFDFAFLKSLLSKDKFFMDGFYVLSSLFIIIWWMFWYSPIVIFISGTLSIFVCAYIWRLTYFVINKILYNKKRLVWLIVGVLSLATYWLFRFIVNHEIGVSIFFRQYVSSGVFSLISLSMVFLVFLRGIAITSYIVSFLSVYNLLGFNKITKKIIKAVFYMISMGLFVIQLTIAAPLCTFFAKNATAYKTIDIPYKEEFSLSSRSLDLSPIVKIELGGGYDKELEVGYTMNRASFFEGRYNFIKIDVSGGKLWHENKIISKGVEFIFTIKPVDDFLLLDGFGRFSCGSWRHDDLYNVLTIKGKHYTHRERNAGYSFVDKTPISVRNKPNNNNDK